jgi:O-acetyl-ADP-ribose deacetylase (regulator of RNase III)
MNNQSQTKEDIQMTIKVIEGNILMSDKDIIVQQVNCLGVMGAGLAKSIYQRYPEVLKEYRKFCAKPKAQAYSLLGMVNYVDTYDDRIVANVFGQVGIRKGRDDKKVYTDTNALLKGISNVKRLAEENNFSVAIPTYIGCGLANGDWNEIKNGIEEVFANSDVDVTFYHYR